MDPFERVEFKDWEVPDFGSPQDPSERTRKVAYQISECLSRNHLILLDGGYSDVGLDPAQYAQAEFVENPDFMKGRRRSRQGVFAGVLTVSTEHDPAVDTFVAIKPYDRRRVGFLAHPAHMVAHDWATNHYLNQLSTGTAYQTYGLWRNHDTFYVPALLTRFNERSVSLDNPLLPKDTDSEEVYEKRLRRTLSLGNFGLGFAHGAGILHGDAFPQNFAVNGRRVIFNDTTTLRPFFSKRPDRNRRGIVDDVRDFFAGVFHKDVSTPILRGVARTALHTPQMCEELIASYIKGANLGAERVKAVTGHATVGEVIDPQRHIRIVREAAERSIN